MMSGISTHYANGLAAYRYNVTFRVINSGAILTRSFDSEYMARKFVNKLRHSKKCALLSYPLFK